MPLWGVLIMGRLCVGAYGRSLYLPLDFVVNLKLLLKNCLQKTLLAQFALLHRRFRVSESAHTPGLTCDHRATPASSVVTCGPVQGSRHLGSQGTWPSAPSFSSRTVNPRLHRCLCRVVVSPERGADVLSASCNRCRGGHHPGGSGRACWL